MYKICMDIFFNIKMIQLYHFLYRRKKLETRIFIIGIYSFLCTSELFHYTLEFLFEMFSLIKQIFLLFWKGSPDDSFKEIVHSCPNRTFKNLFPDLDKVTKMIFVFDGVVYIYYCENYPLLVSLWSENSPIFLPDVRVIILPETSAFLSEFVVFFFSVLVYFWILCLDFSV